MIKGGGLAGFKTIAFRVLGGGGGGRKRKIKISKRKIRVKEKFMDFWHKMIFPVRRFWFTVSSPLKARKNGAGLLKLRDDIQTCGYQDVQVMWEMLRRSETEHHHHHHPKSKQRPFWRVFVWSSSNNTSSSTSLSADHA